MPLIDVGTGSVIAGYRIEELAGRGGMGVVYRATQLALDRQVALKLIAPEFANDALFRQRFKRESRLAASIDHPNVIPVHEAGDAEGLLFISMRWVGGTDLDTLIRREGGLEPERAVALVAQVGAALDAAHARGLIHRDVKPGNVLVVPGPVEHVYLTDFGLVKRLRASAALTRSGQLLGTLDYVAPEQIQRTGGDARSDVYSLGCVLFHCVTGRVPFETDDDVANAHLNDSPPAPSELAPGLLPVLDLVVARDGEGAGAALRVCR
jgi:serine/threonine protein kinase